MPLTVAATPHHPTTAPHLRASGWGSRGEAGEGAGPAGAEGGYMAEEKKRG
jgi:hypothetical protein